jgi:hypothetical protein
MSADSGENYQLFVVGGDLSNYAQIKLTLKVRL